MNAIEQYSKRQANGIPVGSELDQKLSAILKEEVHHAETLQDWISKILPRDKDIEQVFKEIKDYIESKGYKFVTSMSNGIGTTSVFTKLKDIFVYRDKLKISVSDTDRPAVDDYLTLPVQVEVEPLVDGLKDLVDGLVGSGDTDETKA